MSFRCTPSSLRVACLRRLIALWCCCIPLLGAADAWALAAPAEAPPASAPTAPAAAVSTASPQASPFLPPGAQTYRIPLLRHYADQGLTLRGEDSYGGMDFGLRQDERVVRVRLNLDYSYSPTLLPALSHLKVLLNGVVGATIPLSKSASSTFEHLSVDLPVSVLSKFNHLNLELIAHSEASDKGNDPQSPDLWLKANSGSMLELTVVPVDLPNELSLLPAPFFDAHDERTLELPVVLPHAPDASRLESAGIVTSWFGALADYRGARFTASLGAVPAHGHAVVLALPGELPGLTMPAVNGPTLAIVPNPNDPNGKLLLITGRDDAEIRQAAMALATGAQTLSGPQARINAMVTAAPRKPFDAPKWLRSDRPMQLGELMPADTFTAQGLQPRTINVNLRLPPGLFGWNNPGAKLNLHYSYTQRPTSLHSELTVLSGNQLLQSLPLSPSASDGHAELRIPTYLLPPLATLQFHFRYEFLKPDGNYQDVPGGSIESAIDPTSTIDISHLPHYEAMPDLRAFGDAGFPFTRMADLSETAVIMPDKPGVDDYSAYLTLMGGMGQATGYPTLGVTVGSAAQAKSLSGKDLLVLDSGGDQPLINAWRGDLPRSFFDPGAAPSSGNGFLNLWDKLKDTGESGRRAATGDLYRGGDRQGMVAGLMSPLEHGRSVVVLSSNTPAGLNAVVSTLLTNRYLIEKSAGDKIGGSLAVVHDGAITTLQDDRSYYVGRLPLWLAVEWFFANHMLLLLVATLVGVALIGLLGGVFLHRRALYRLELEHSQT
ncbi:cellulose biosynthesis cyclic di-GMP-binding regulatory protein BcsB [Bordetella sp. FB-8]|uniref:cellulose biosynthesis cyclic di-GMP-binding regulatory protein BcsB n=1 Tax=Bordetella sp. FB-8 TaxID=1159870 RepID=UPI000371970A|nr:cellulose biosynthesis cyclic di-GMP-binding regulatory protein BcsB [Bordetella sp. FB-8]